MPVPYVVNNQRKMQKSGGYSYAGSLAARFTKLVYQTLALLAVV